MPPAQRPEPARFLVGAVVVIICLAIGWPAAVVGWTIVRGVLHEPLDHKLLIPSARLLATTIGWALGIAIVSTLLAWPAAWLIRRKGWSIVPLLLVPLLLPSYLAYSAFGLLRSPGTLLGDWVQNLAKEGYLWAPSARGA